MDRPRPAAHPRLPAPSSRTRHRVRVPTVVAGGAKRAQIRNVIRAAVAPLDHVIDDQPANETSRRRAAIDYRTAVAIPLENCRSYSFPGLRSVARIVRLRSLTRSRCPARRAECWWFDRHGTALRLSVYARIKLSRLRHVETLGTAQKKLVGFLFEFPKFCVRRPGAVQSKVVPNQRWPLPYLCSTLADLGV